MLEGMVRKQTEKQAQTLDSWLEKHDREVPFPEGVRLHGDQDYMGDGKPCHRMDVYEPELNPKEGPVLVNFHGGGFLLGKKQVNRLFCADMCLHGFTVFCPEYPLVPEVGIFDIFRDLTVAVNRAGEEAAGTRAGRCLPVRGQRRSIPVRLSCRDAGKSGYGGSGGSQSGRAADTGTGTYQRDVLYLPSGFHRDVPAGYAVRKGLA